MKKDYSEAYNNLGISYTVLKRFDESVKALKNTTALEENANYYLNLGNAYVELKRFQDALVAYKKLIELDDGIPSTHFNWDNLYYRFGEVNMAVEEYKKAIEKYKKKLGEVLS